MTRPALGTPRRTLQMVLLAAALAGTKAAAAPPSRPHVDPQLGPFVLAQIQRAAERLERAPCSLVLGDFVDPETGRPLSEKLAATGTTPAGYLGSLTYLPGSLDGVCRDTTIGAYTSPGSQIVYVCPRRFQRWQASKEQNLPAAILIHEALHTLGLGENPPTTEEITARVAARCGR